MKIASIDIGSNTIILLIASVNPDRKEISPVLNVHRMPRLGKGLLPGYEIPCQKVDELRSILAEYKKIIEDYEVQNVILTATNALRIASNGTEICDEILNEFNFRIKIISGDEEAKLAYLGSTFWISEQNNFVVIDIGGGSTEIISGTGNVINFKQSFPIGSVSATEKYLLNDPPSSDELISINYDLNELFEPLDGLDVAGHFPIAIAGTPTTLACINQNLTEFDWDKVEMSSLSRMDLTRITDTFTKLTYREIEDRWSKIMRGRSDIILAGSIILLCLMNKMKFKSIYVSTKGIRFGAIVKYLMDKKIL